MKIKEKLTSLIEQVEELKKQEHSIFNSRLNDVIETLGVLRMYELFLEEFNIEIKLFGKRGTDSFFEIENMPTRVHISYWKSNSIVNNSQKQPEVGKWLLCFDYPTGAYVFGNEYIWDLFNDFWEELKSYKYDFVDDLNHSLYFYLENSKDIIENYHEIFSKYKSKYKDYSIKAEKKRLERRLKEIEKENENGR